VIAIVILWHKYL